MYSIDLVSGQLPALARLGALRHLDLQLVAVDQIVAGDAEAARGHLLDGAAAQIAVGDPAVKRTGSSPPSPVFDLPPMRFIAIASVSCASRLIDPSDIAPVLNRLTISVAGSTSSIGIGLAGLNFSSAAQGRELFRCRRWRAALYCLNIL